MLRCGTARARRPRHRRSVDRRGALRRRTFPALTGRVVDAAKILSPVTIADLERKLADLEQKSGIQLDVATVPSLEGEEIEPYANDLFRFWKLGEAKKDNGALLLIAPKERRVRIEVGYGLEGTLTDAISSLIIANAIAPRFKAGDFNGGVTRGVDDIITTLTTDLAEWKPRSRRYAGRVGCDAVRHHRALFDHPLHSVRLQPDQPTDRRQRDHPDGRRRLRPRRRFGGGGFGGGGSSGGGGFSGGGGSSGGGGASGGW